MSKRQILILLGIWFGIFLFLGLPEGWHTTIAAISGLVLIIVAYSLKPEPVKTDLDADVPFVEQVSTENKSEVVVSPPTPNINNTNTPNS